MSDEAEIGQPLVKRDKKKLLKSIWLICLVTFFISFFTLFTVNFLTGKELKGFVADIFSFGIIFSLPIGIITFIIWIFTPGDNKIPKPLTGLFKLGIGFVVSLLFSVVIYTITEFLLVDFDMGTEEGWGYLAQILLSFVTFLAILFFWIKSKSIKTNLIILFALFALYLFGREYAKRAIKPYFEAQQIITEAQQDMAWTKEVDSALFLKGEQDNVSKYKQATRLNLDNYPAFKKYVDDLYSLKNEILLTDEKLASGELKYSQEELEKLSVKYTERQNVLSNALPLPFWISFYQIEVN